MENRSAAAWVGLLFLVAMAVSIAGNLLILPVIGSDDYLAEVVSSEVEIRIAAILMIVNSISVVGIGALVYQIFREAHTLLAVSYLATRIVEAVTLAFGVISILSLLSIGDEYAQIDEASGAYLVSQGISAISRNWYAYNIAMIFLGTGSLFFCYVLLRRRLIPTLLSALGIAGYFILALSSVLAVLDTNLGLISTAPVFLFEVTLGVWLLARGFNAPQQTSITPGPG